MKKLNVALIFGGKSGEHEVSLSSVTSICKHINKEKYNLFTIGITKEGKWAYYEGNAENIKNGTWINHIDENVELNLIPYFNKQIGIKFKNRFESIDVIFPVLHGPYGEDGCIQGLFELMNVAYVGCGVLASSVGMDKLVSKDIFDKAGLSQVKYKPLLKYEFLQNEEKVVQDIESELKYPIFVKPANMGSSVGISKAKNKEQLIKAINIALKYDKRVIVEEGINAREIEVSVLGNEDVKASIAGEIIPSKEFYDYEAKYLSEASKLLIPAPLDEKTMEDVRNMAIKAFKSIDGTGFARVDFFIDKDTNNLYINELNTLPGFTNISMYPKLWENTNLSYSDLIDSLIELAIQRQKQRGGSVER